VYFKFPRPPRLYCGNCEETYRLPTFKKKGGKIRQHGDFKCPIDNFGLLVVSTGTDSKSYTLCPNCFNNPTLEGMKAGSGCNQCPHPTCTFSYKNFIVAPCDKCDNVGMMCLDHLGTRLDCNICNHSILLPKAKRIKVLSQLAETGDHLLEFEFVNNGAPLELETLLDQTEKTTVVQASYLSHPIISVMVDELNGRKRGRGGRGGDRGGGRGGRGRGGRGRRGRRGRFMTDEELKMSFHGF